MELMLIGVSRGPSDFDRDRGARRLAEQAFDGGKTRSDSTT
jgi:hypothetical protein